MTAPQALVSVSPETLRKAARHWTAQLLSYYPTTTMPDPSFVDGITDILSTYPENVMARVCNRTSGLPVKTQFLPTLKEIKSACEEEMRVWYEKSRTDRIAAEQFKLRDEIDQIERERAEGKRATYEQLIAKLPENLRMKRPSDKFMPAWVPTLDELCAKHNIKNPYAEEQAEEKNPFEDL